MNDEHKIGTVGSRGGVFETSEEFKCALTRIGHQQKNKLCWLPQGRVLLTKHGGNEIELEIEKAKTRHPYRLTAHNLCGLETGRIMVPSNKPFCCQRRQRKESHYVLIAMDDNCGEHPVILLTNLDPQIINNWKWHFQNTLAFVNSWPNLELQFYRDDTPERLRVTLMLTKTWLSIFKFQKFKLPQLWLRMRITSISDIYEDNELNKKHLVLICHKGTLRLTSSRCNDIFNNLDVLWRVTLTQPAGTLTSHRQSPAIHPNPPPPPDDSDTSSLHPRSEHTAPANSSSGYSGNSEDSNKQIGCNKHSPLLVEMMDNQQDSSGRIQVSCSDCLQSGSFNQEKEQPPRPCTGKMPVGEYIDRPYLPMNKAVSGSMQSLASTTTEAKRRSSAFSKQGSRTSLHQADVITPTLELNELNENPNVREELSNHDQMDGNGVNKPITDSVTNGLETIHSEPEDVVSLEITEINTKQLLRLASSESEDNYKTFKEVDENFETQKKSETGTVPAQAEPRSLTPLNLTVNDRIVGNNRHEIDDVKQHPSESQNIARITPNKASQAAEDIDEGPKPLDSKPNLSVHLSPPRKLSGAGCMGKTPTPRADASLKSCSLPRGCYADMSVKMYDMNILGAEMKSFYPEDRHRIQRLMSSQAVTRAQFYSGHQQNQQYISMGTEHIQGAREMYSHFCHNQLPVKQKSEEKPKPSQKGHSGLRRYNSVDSRRRKRPTSSLYVYWSATNIVHTLYRLMRGKPPADTLGLSTKERKELCVRLFTSMMDEGKHDWRALAEEIGLKLDAVWIIETFQSNVFNKCTAGEIVLKHWQFCYNSYGINAEKCPVACTRVELMRLLTRIGRQDLIEEVFAKKQMYADLPSPNWVLKRPTEEANEGKSQDHKHMGDKEDDVSTPDTPLKSPKFSITLPDFRYHKANMEIPEWGDIQFGGDNPSFISEVGDSEPAYNSVFSDDTELELFSHKEIENLRRINPETLSVGESIGDHSVVDTKRDTLDNTDEYRKARVVESSKEIESDSMMAKKEKEMLLPEVNPITSNIVAPKRDSNAFEQNETANKGVAQYPNTTKDTSVSSVMIEDDYSLDTPSNKTEVDSEKSSSEITILRRPSPPVKSKMDKPLAKPPILHAKPRYKPLRGDPLYAELKRKRNSLDKSKVIYYESRPTSGLSMTVPTTFSDDNSNVENGSQETNDAVKTGITKIMRSNTQPPNNPVNEDSAKRVGGMTQITNNTLNVESTKTMVSHRSSTHAESSEGHIGTQTVNFNPAKPNQLVIDEISYL